MGFASDADGLEIITNNFSFFRSSFHSFLLGSVNSVPFFGQAASLTLHSFFRILFLTLLGRLTLSDSFAILITNLNMKFTSTILSASLLGYATASPLGLHRHRSVHRRVNNIHKREVPQEHSHDLFLTITNDALKLENPKGIVDAVFGLLGNGAAAAGAGEVTNLDCLKQETADQAYTNAKAAGDLKGMAGALLYQAIERNTGSVGAASVLCTDAAVNPEIAALTQHQDPASENAGATNKAITLELAKQLASIGADPNLALLSGTFAPGEVS